MLSMKRAKLTAKYVILLIKKNATELYIKSSFPNLSYLKAGNSFLVKINHQTRLYIYMLITQAKIV